MDPVKSKHCRSVPWYGNIQIKPNQLIGCGVPSPSRSPKPRMYALIQGNMRHHATSHEKTPKCRCEILLERVVWNPEIIWSLAILMIVDCSIISKSPILSYHLHANTFKNCTNTICLWVLDVSIKSSSCASGSCHGTQQRVGTIGHVVLTCLEGLIVVLFSQLWGWHLKLWKHTSSTASFLSKKVVEDKQNDYIPSGTHMFAIRKNRKKHQIFTSSTRRRPPHQSLPFDFPRQRGDPINCSHLRGVEDGFRGVL